MCLTPERRDEVLKQRPDWNVLDDKALDDALAADYLAGTPAVVAAATKIDELKAENTALSAAKAEADAEVLRLSAAVDAGERKVLELSGAAPKAPDAVTLSMYADNVAAKREAAVKAGAVTEAQAKGLDALLADSGGNPTALALSAAGPSRKPLAFAVWDWVGGLGEDGPKAGNKVARGATAAEPPRYETMDLSGAGGTQPKLSDAELQARVDANLAQTELGRRALANRKAKAAEVAGAGK